MLTAPSLESGIVSTLADKPAGMVVDLRQTDFLASAGINVLVQGSSRAGDHGVGFAVVADSPATSRPIELLGLATILGLHPQLDDALASLPESR